MRILITHLVAVFLFANPLVIQGRCCCAKSIPASTQKNCDLEDAQTKSCCSVKEQSVEVERKADAFRPASCRNTSECCCIVGKSKTSFVPPKLIKFESKDVVQLPADSQDLNLFPKAQRESLVASYIPPPCNSLNILYCVRLE